MTRSTTLTLALGGILAATAVGCTAAQPATPAPSPSAKAEWSYSGSNGPEHWGEYGAACEATSASHESPIAIDTAKLMPGSASSRVVPHYTAAAFELENNGHTIEAVPEDAKANSVELNGKTYYLQQFHFHATSEHTVNGKSTPAELHLVHKADDGTLLVLGVLIETGRPNTALAEVFESIPAKTSEEGEKLQQPIDPHALLPQNLESVQYAGSLTTPPCSEGVQWNLFLNPVSISAEQLAAYTAVYPDNHRPVQPLHDRTLTEVPSV
ncbi:carbonic anhydrase family protein [Leucobacter iarius]|uniref:carbonic anhydrase n=1 Tax=Leucobacter iarius TaxID=333963 RepID=A0ABP4XZ15_9MICO